MGSSSVVHIHSHSTMAKVAIYFNCLFHLIVPSFLCGRQFCHLNLTKLLQYLCVSMLLSMQLSENIGTTVAKIKNSTIQYWFCFKYCPSIQLF